MLTLLTAVDTMQAETGGSQGISYEELSKRSLGTGVWVCMGLYLFSLLMCGFVPWVRNKGWRRNTAGPAQGEADGVSKHFIAGGTLGFFVTPLTLFATLFSGVSLVGIPSEASVRGFYALRWGIAVIPRTLGLMLMGPRMRRWSDYRGGYMTGCDVLSDRFRDGELRAISAIIQMFAAFLYVLAQFVAIGASVFALTNGNVSRVWGAAGLAVIMYLYEALGGMKAVAWTDVIQGCALLMGFVFLFTIQKTEFGGVQQHVSDLSVIMPELIAVPDLAAMGDLIPYWFGMLSAGLYGHMQMRCFAASSEKTFRTGVIFLSIISALVAIGSTFMGLIGRSYFLQNFPGEEVPRDETFGLMMRVLMLDGDTSETSANYVLGAIILAASVAALMSTADSALLSLSSFVCLDVVKPFMWPRATVNQIVWLGRGVSLTASIIGVAVSSTDPDIVSLILSQQRYLMQILPGFFGALFFKKCRSRPITIGLVCGMIVVTVMVFGGFEDSRIASISGVVGLAINLVVVMVAHNIDKWKPELRPYLESGWRGPDVAWERFGEPLPLEMVGYKVPKWTHELIHPPSTYFYGVLACMMLLFSFPWFRAPGSFTIVAGMPGWAVQNLVTVAIASPSLALTIYKGWIPLPESWWKKVKDIESQESGSTSDSVYGKDISEDSLVSNASIESSMLRGDIVRQTTSSTGDVSTDSSSGMNASLELRGSSIELSSPQVSPVAVSA